MTATLATDAYKLSMAQAGFPLRRETFYLSFRRGGPQFVAFDLAAVVAQTVDAIEVDDGDLAFARRFGYGLGDAMEHALRLRSDALEIVAVPPGTWVLEREPILSVTGPSFLVSWLEPMLLWQCHPIQLATAWKLGQVTPPMCVATCGEHEAIVRKTAEAVGVSEPEVVREDDAYRERVRKAVRALVEAAGDPMRVFEVGMRSASCMEQHRIALEACKAEGVVQTSNVLLARELDLKPVGTMGHEHVQRWGNDRDAFRAMRDMRASPPSYLLDTFDTMGSGIGAAVEVMREREHACAIRYDSGNKFIQYLHACELLVEQGLQPTHVLEDGLDIEATRHFEALREFTRWPRNKQIYGYGGSIVAASMTNPLTRDRVSAVYKLTETGGEPRMKFGNERGLGKQSVPGRPVLWRRRPGKQGPLGIIGQQGEPVHEDYLLVSGNVEALERRSPWANELPQLVDADPDAAKAELSPATAALVERVRRELGSDG